MAKTSLFPFIALAALVPGLIQGAVISAGGNSNQFTYLGSISNPSRLRGGVKATTSYYFLSQNAAAYAIAAEDCKAFLGDDATLVYLETQEELNILTKMLTDSDDTGSSYWVGGRYDTGRSTFVWDNGVDIGPWAPWDQGHPNTRTPVTRVYARTVGGLVLRTQFNTVTTRFICELKTGGMEPEPCYDDNDLVIAVDASSSMGQTHYQVALEFVTKLAVAWANNPGNRLSVLVYSSQVQSVFGLTQKVTVSQIRDLISNAPYLNGGTATDMVLDRALLEFIKFPRSVPKNLVFLTDGASNSPSATLAAAQRVQSAGIRAFSVGIGMVGIRETELLAIAGNNPNYVFSTSGFDDLLKSLQPVSRMACM